MNSNYFNVHPLPDYQKLNIKIAATGVIAVTGLLLGVSGTVVEKGSVKAIALVVSAGFGVLCCKNALEGAQSANAYDLQTQLLQEASLQQLAKSTSLMVEASGVVAEEDVLSQVATMLPQQPTVAESQQPTVTQQQQQQPTVTQQQQPTVTQPTVVAQQPVATQQTDIVLNRAIPDTAALIEIENLNDVNKYPVIMVVAEQGSGKTVTVATIFERLSGKKVLATPKIQDHQNHNLSEVYSLKFGYDSVNQHGRYIGHIDDYDSLENHDLSWYLEENPEGSHYLDFVLATTRESTNRQKYGMDSDANYWRVFGDEWSDIYSNGFLDPLKSKKDISQAKGYIEQCIKSAFFNFRGQRVQLWVGCQSETIDSIGAKGIASARDIAWHLYPGKAAIEVAKKFGKHSLAKYLSDRVSKGYGVALLEKNGLYFEVINLPTLAYMGKFDSISCKTSEALL